jgi:CRISPR/Cas system-associated endonuclease Cas1
MEKIMQKTTVEANGAVRRITTHEASIKTATVEVKALTISGKQVTLSVFRQLQNEELIGYFSGQLKGVPWGRVNYNPGDCVEDVPHIHVVWQQGSELRRSCVRVKSRVPYTLKDAKADAECRYLAQAVLEGKITELSEHHRSLMDSDESLKAVISWYLNSLKEKQRLLSYIPSASNDSRLKSQESTIEGRREKLREYTCERPYQEGSIEQTERAIAEFENNWKQSYAAVASTEQLFIAV